MQFVVITLPADRRRRPTEGALNAFGIASNDSPRRASPDRDASFTRDSCGLGLQSCLRQLFHSARVVDRFVTHFLQRLARERGPAA